MGHAVILIAANHDRQVLVQSLCTRCSVPLEVLGRGFDDGLERGAIGFVARLVHEQDVQIVLERILQLKVKGGRTIARVRECVQVAQKVCCVMHLLWIARSRKPWGKPAFVGTSGGETVHELARQAAIALACLHDFQIRVAIVGEQRHKRPRSFVVV